MGVERQMMLGFSNLIIPGFTCDLSLVNGVAFITNPLISLAAFVGKKITLTGGGKTLIGWGKEVGPGESLGSESLSNTAFETTLSWVTTDCTIASVAGGQTGNCLEITRTGGTWQRAWTSWSITSGRLYKQSGYVKSAGLESYSAEIPIASSLLTGTATGGWVGYSGYGTGIATGGVTYELKRLSAVAGTMLFDTVSVKQVLTPSEAGLTIVSTKGGAVQNWTSDDGIDPNRTTFTLTVSSE